MAGMEWGNHIEEGNWGKWNQDNTKAPEISENKQEEQMLSAKNAVENVDLNAIWELLNKKDLGETAARYIVENTSFAILIKMTYTSPSPSTAGMILGKANKGTVYYRDNLEKVSILNTLSNLKKISTWLN